MPDANEALAQEFHAPLFHSERGSRSPAGVYAISFGQILTRFERLLDAVGACVAEWERGTRPPALDFKPFVESLDAVLDALAEHLEDTVRVLQCFFPPTADYTRDPVVRGYRKKVESYRSFVARRVNHIKHAQGRIRPVVALVHARAHMGYFFEGITSDGVVGPHPDIHEQTSVYSIARDVRFHLLHVFYVGTALGEAVRTLGRPVKPLPRADEDSSNKSLQVLRRVAGLPHVLFPGERRLEWPLIKVDQKPARVALNLIPSPPDYLVEIQDGTDVSIAYESDGTPNQKFAMPFYRRGR